MFQHETITADTKPNGIQLCNQYLEVNWQNTDKFVGSRNIKGMESKENNAFAWNDEFSCNKWWSYTCRKRKNTTVPTAEVTLEV